MKHNHFSTWLFISTLAVCGLNACDDADNSNNSSCDQVCAADQECINGVCKTNKG
ncbi:MAG: hypothetical protein IJM59_03600 [Proteobacteria bacterium]|nr:hypothetical protein [Pseudomonadota bacterium]